MVLRLQTSSAQAAIRHTLPYEKPGGYCHVVIYGPCTLYTCALVESQKETFRVSPLWFGMAEKAW